MMIYVIQYSFRNYKKGDQEFYLAILAAEDVKLAKIRFLNDPDFSTRKPIIMSIDVYEIL